MRWTKLGLYGCVAAGLIGVSGCRTAPTTAIGPAPANGRTLTLIADGKSDYAIVVPDDEWRSSSTRVTKWSSSHRRTGMCRAIARTVAPSPTTRASGSGSYTANSPNR